MRRGQKVAWTVGVVMLIAFVASAAYAMAVLVSLAGAGRIGSIRPPEPLVVDLARCVDVPEGVRSEIEAAFMVGEITMIGDDFYRLRLDRAVTGDWAAVEASAGSEMEGYWIGVWVDVAHSSALPRMGNPFRPFNEAEALAVYFQEGDFGGPGQVHRYGDDYVDGYKLQVADLPDLASVQGVPESSWHPPKKSRDDLATLAGCLGYEYPVGEYVYWSHAPWLGEVQWAHLSGEPQWAGKGSTGSG